MSVFTITFAYIGPGAGFAFLGSFLVLVAAVVLALTSLATLPLRVLLRALFRGRRRQASAIRRVVILGFDGCDPRRVRAMFERGELPALRSLAERGCFHALATTTPPISPVAWSSFMTGVNPGKHRIFDFLARNPRTYRPELSSSRVVGLARGRGLLRRLLGSRAEVLQLRKGKPFWHTLGEHGVYSTILRVPITFPPEPFYGTLLSGMCVPDIRGTQGSYTEYYLSDAGEQTETTGGLRIPVTLDDGTIATDLPGPPLGQGEMSENLTVPLSVDRLTADSARLRVNGQWLTLTVGQTSDWVEVSFRGSGRRRVHGICLFHLVASGPAFRLYVSPINIDPERPAMRVSHPAYYAIYLAKLHGAFATLGLAEDTHALSEGILNEAAFMAQVERIQREREGMFFDALHKLRRGLLVCVFDATDRTQHMFQHVPDAVAGDAPDPIATAYGWMDDIVRRTLEQLGPRDTLFVMSDHGFTTFERCVSLNAWLQQTGRLVLSGAAPGAPYFADVDWARTQAYAFGLSGIYLNRAGREAGGILSAAAADELKRDLVAELVALKDGPRGCQPIHAVHDAQDVYRGPYAQDGPDLIVGYREGYRASWDDVIGRTGTPLFADNDTHWNGDHCVDPSFVPGVLFCSRHVAETDPHITDMAATVLDMFGVTPPDNLDGRVLTVADSG